MCKKTNVLIVTILICVGLSRIAYGQENLTLRTDRDVYVAGEVVWLSTSIESAVSTVSKVIYVELLNGNNVPIQQVKALVSNGVANTQFTIPDTLATGNYQVRAYTKWMQNFSATFFEHKTITVINPFTKHSYPQKESAFKADTIIFYAEGGKILINKPNTITLQALNKYGKAMAFKGHVLTSRGDTLNTLQCSNKGLTTFILTPTTTDKLYVKAVASSKKIALPATIDAQNQYVLHLNKSLSNVVSFEIRTNNTDKKKGFVHVSSMQGSFVSSQEVTIRAAQSIDFNAAKLPNGYLIATLLSKDGLVLASRYFMAHAQEIKQSIELIDLKSHYGLRENVLFGIENKGHLKNISLTVTKPCLLSDDSPFVNTLIKNIPFSTLLDCTTDSISINDLLVCFAPPSADYSITQANTYAPEFNGLIVSGKITSKENYQALPNQVLSIGFVGKHPAMSVTKSDSLGNFTFEANQFGEKELVIQPLNNEKTAANYTIELNSNFSNNYAGYKTYPLSLSAEQVNEINTAIINMQINAVYSSASKPSVRQQESDFYGKPEVVRPIGKYITLVDMEEIIKEIIPFTITHKRKDNYEIEIMEATNLYPREGKSMVLVDGIPIQDINLVIEMQPNKIERIDLINLDYYMDGYYLGRLLSIITTAGNLSALKFDNAIFRQAHHGYQPMYDFKSPDYSSSLPQKPTIPDFRNVLYWNANVSTNTSNHISFFTSDEEGDFVIKVEGVNEDGQIERNLFPLKVKK